MPQRHSKVGAGRKDTYYYRAKEAGFRSRAAFKILQLDQKYSIFSNARCCLDLCAAPGGWSQVAAKKMPIGSLIIAVDLDPIKPIPGVRTLVGDITTQQTRSDLKGMLTGWEVDCVLNDGAPNMGASWSKDAYTQSELVLFSLKLASEFLKPGGTFVSKVFRSKDYANIMYAMRQLFATVVATKPPSSRETSAEVFVVCKGYKAPEYIDPKLLDAQTLFKDDELSKAAAHKAGKHATIESLSQKKGKKIRANRQGYDAPLFSTCSMLDIAVAPHPLDLIELNNKITTERQLDTAYPPNATIAWTIIDEYLGNGKRDGGDKSPLSLLEQEEIKEICSDLKVLGKSDLLRLNKAARDLRGLLRDAGVLEGAREELGVAEGDEDEQQKNIEEKKRKEDEREAQQKANAVIANPEDPEAIKQFVERQRKKEERRRREELKRRLRQSSRLQRKGNATMTAEIADQEGSRLFSITEAVGGENKGLKEQDRKDDEWSSISSTDSENSDQPQIEGDCDVYVEGMEEMEIDDASGAPVKEKLGYLDAINRSYEEFYKEKERRSVARTEREKTAKVAEERGTVAINKRHKNQEQADEEMGEADDADKTNTTDEHTYILTEGSKALSGAAQEAIVASEKRLAKQLKGMDRRDRRDLDEEEPSEASESSDTGEIDFTKEFNGLSLKEKAERKAILKKMLRKGGKRDLVDAAYSRWATFETEEERKRLPSWFVVEEEKHMRPIPSITKEEAEEERRQMRAALRVEPRRVQEAKGRKRARAEQRAKILQGKAEELNEAGDLSEVDKMRQLKKLASKLSRKEKDRNKKGPLKVGKRFAAGMRGKGKTVDRRMKKDVRNEQIKKRKARGGRRR